MNYYDFRFCLYTPQTRNMKKLFYLFGLFIGFFLQSNAQSAKTVINLSQKDKQNSQVFQSLKGKDRLELFKQLQTLVRIKGSAADAVTASNRIGAKTTTLAEVVALLGKPDAMIQQSLIEYNLKQGSSTKAVIGLNKDGEVQFCTIKN